jgi:phage/plasmid primase-like uncharacterized protein
MSAYESDFRAALSTAGISLPSGDGVIVDDQIHRFSAPDDKEKSAYYSLHLHPSSNGEPIVNGVYGRWGRVELTRWCSRQRGNMSREEAQSVAASIQAMMKRMIDEERAGQEKARLKCRDLFATSPRAAAHPYLTKKGITASPATAISPFDPYPGWLAIPLQDSEGTIWSAQLIADDGTKRFLYQGRVKGCYHQFSDVNHGGPILICEGYATGASLFMSTGWTVVCAMNCGNLEPVARSFRSRYPDRTLLIAADNDQFTPDNPGLTKGKTAARASKSLLAFPEFADEALGDKPTDFNDLHRLAGLREVKRQVHQSFPILKLLSDREWNPNARPPEALPVFKLKGITISTPSNISTITAAVKSGKSAGIESMAAATLAGTDCDTLGFESGNPDAKALLHFDSEQSPEDHWHHVDRIIRRAHAAAAPKWLRSWCLTGLTFKQCQNCVWEAIRIAREEYPGILAVLIDGYCDLVSDVNDSAESNDFVARLHGLAIQYACHISGVIHLNPGTEKSRGHLGSQLERKAETNLQMEKDKEDESSLIFSTKNRRAGIPRNLGVAFKWDDNLKMHVSCDPSIYHANLSGRPNEVSKIAAMNSHEFLAACLPEGESRNLIARRLESWLAVHNVDASESTCRRAVILLVANGKLRKDPASGLYLKGPNA